VLFGLGKATHPERTPFLPGKLASALPAGTFRFGNPPDDPALGALAFALQTYRYTRHKGATGGTGKSPRLVVPEGTDGEELRRLADAVSFGRDLVNTPANDLGPEDLGAVAVDLARAHGALVEVISGDALVDRGFPLVHAVGKGSARPPCLVDIHWGDPTHPKVTLVGKGVVFDTGGLDIKPPSGMAIMKKDMGGAAAILALARLVMQAGLKLRLRVLLPILENAISGSAFRPGDVYKSRKGLTVEIGDTDAEGRLILADALAAADEDRPDLIVDMATLTGAARVALGQELPPFYTHDDALAAEIAAASLATFDPVWRLPLWRPYLPMLDSKIADTNNITSSSFAGSMTAALFLSKFVENATSWVHFDVYAWNQSARAGRPEGGDVQATRAVYAVLKSRFAAA
jgi:leucyl aminopeptidase